MNHVAPRFGSHLEETRSMRALRSTIELLRDHGSELPEPYCDCFDANPPSSNPWPGGLPTCPPLQEFYAACDGGRIGPYQFLPRDELSAETAAIADWMESIGSEELPQQGLWLVLGHNEYGHTLIWDADRDAVLLYDSDGGDLWDADNTRLAYDGSWPGSTGHLTLAQFFDRLVNPARDSPDETTQLWREALQHLDRLG
jgi:hypothetical protein